MLLGGVEVEDRCVQRLAGAVQHRELSRKLSMALALRAPVVNLTVAERHTILSALDAQVAGLEGLREELLGRPSWQLRERI